MNVMKYICTESLELITRVIPLWISSDLDVSSWWSYNCICMWAHMWSTWRCVCDFTCKSRILSGKFEKNASKFCSTNSQLVNLYRNPAWSNRRIQESVVRVKLHGVKSPRPHIEIAWQSQIYYVHAVIQTFPGLQSTFYDISTISLRVIVIKVTLLLLFEEKWIPRNFVFRQNIAF